MTRIYQYQGKAEPVSQDAEAVRIDKWQGVSPEPRRAGIFASAIFAASLFFVPVVSAVETVTIDKWFKQSPTPIVKKADINRGYFDIDSNLFTQSEDIKVSSWFQRTSEPVRTKPQIVRQYYDIDGNLFTQSEDIKVSSWFQRTSEPVRRVVFPVTPPYFTFVDFSIPGVETITLDKWYRPLTEPIRKLPDITNRISGFEIDSLLLTQEENITVDKWFKELSRPVFSAPELTRASSVSFVELVTELITLDKWHVQYHNPEISQKDANEYIYYHSIDPVILTQGELITLDKWFKELSIPARLIVRPVNTPHNFLVEVVVILKQVRIDDITLSQSKLNTITLSQSKLNTITLVQ